jgi:hypothetical protein
MDFGALVLSPLLGRFLSADSIVPSPRDPQSLDRYAYARNSPLVRVDPSGHADCAAGDNACWQSEWMWQNRWYEAHGFFWSGSSWKRGQDAMGNPIWRVLRLNRFCAILPGKQAFFSTMGSSACHHGHFEMHNAMRKILSGLCGMFWLLCACSAKTLPSATPSQRLETSPTTWISSFL